MSAGIPLEEKRGKSGANLVQRMHNTLMNEMILGINIMLLGNIKVSNQTFIFISISSLFFYSKSSDIIFIVLHIIIVKMKIKITL